MHLPTKMPTIRQVQQYIQQGDDAFSIDLKDAYLHIIIVRHHHHYFCSVGNTHIISGRFCHLGWLQP